MILSKKMAKIITEEKLVEEVLNRGVEDIIDREHLKEALLSGKQLRVKFGVDPTSPNLHLGRAIPIRKMKAFQDLGHKIVIIVGDFTAQIGDPSDKLSKRPMLMQKEIAKNLKTYKSQLAKILDMKKVEFYFNSKWLKKLNFQEISELAECFSVQQMLARRNFKDRYEKQEEISLREFLYPLLQGYDSVKVKADVEVGGFDQLFNLKSGRVIQKHYGQKEQDILTTQMIEGTDGRKMSSSWGNVIALTDSAKDMFGKVMSMADNLVEKYFLLCTDVSKERLGHISERLKSENPRDVKLDLAEEITNIYHGEKKAKDAREEFIRVFSQKEKPEDIKEFHVSGAVSTIYVLVNSGLAQSNSEATRLVEQGGVKINDEVVKDAKEEITFKGGEIVQVGKRNFRKIKI